MFSSELLARSQKLIEIYCGTGLRLATAESCTGGLVSACLTAIPGSSDAVERGFVTYSNEAKSELLGVPPEMIAEFGAVSAEVAEAMARGAVENSHADVAVSITGIAGPGGATPTKPVGLVYLGSCRRAAEPRSSRFVFPGDRSEVRQAAVASAFDILEGLAAEAR